jgi:elongation factor G
MVEAAAEANEELMNKYLETGELTESRDHAGIRTRTIAGEIQPMLCGSAFKNKGVQRMLDAVIDFMPSPIDIPPVPGTDDDDKPSSAAADDDEKFSALAFKLMTDPYVGQLTFVRVYSGVLKSGDSVYNPIRGKKERIGRILQMHANQREEIKEILAGDIAACVGLRTSPPARRCATRVDHHAREDGVPGAGDLAGRRAQDQGRPGEDGHRPGRLAQEDPSFRVKTDEEAARPSSPAWASCTWRSSSTA